MSFFDLTQAHGTQTPVLVEVPHAGLGVPDSARAALCASRRSMERDADIYVDELYEAAPTVGATLLVSRISRHVVDLNRSKDDVDRETVPDHPSPRGLQPRGVVWRMSTDGSPTLTRPLRYAELLERLATFHEPYHRALADELSRLRERFGFAILVAAHSMPSSFRVGGRERGPGRADVVPGTRGRSTADARVIDLVDAHFRAAGLTVHHDEPYRGGWTTGRYGRPSERWHAVQIELNRALYVDEATGRPKRGDFARLQALLLELMTELGALQLP